MVKRTIIKKRSRKSLSQKKSPSQRRVRKRNTRNAKKTRSANLSFLSDTSSSLSEVGSEDMKNNINKPTPEKVSSLSPVVTVERDCDPNLETEKENVDAALSNKNCTQNKVESSQKDFTLHADDVTPKKCSAINSCNDSVVCLSDSISVSNDDSNANRTELADSSCFIIDVEADTCEDNVRSFYTYSAVNKNSHENVTEKTTNGEDELLHSDNKVLPSSSQIDNGPTEEGYINVCSNDESSENLSSCSNNSNSSTCLNDPNSNSSNSYVSNVKEVTSQHVAMFNNIVNQMKNDGFFQLGYSGGKRKFTEDNSNLDKRRDWNCLKKNKTDNVTTKVSHQKLSKQCNFTNDCISLDHSDSDSDVEFVDAFNPQDRLIELSDSEDSVIIEACTPAIIPLPKSKNTKNTKKAVKRKTQIAARKKKNVKTTKAAEKPALLRPIVIDGCNVGMGHSRSKTLSVNGIKICCDYFQTRGHDVKVFLPQYKKYNPLTSDVALLHKMEREGIVIFTPGRKVDGMSINSYDDRFILEYAALKGAIVISRDNYRDLYTEREEFRDTIKNRLLQYTFVDDLIMFPQDPLGRGGPNLEKFLTFPPTENGPSKKSA